MKRFYKQVRYAPDGKGHFCIFLDERPVRTPGGLTLYAPSEPIAAQTAMEWDAQKDLIRPDTMPLTQILINALERIPRERKSITEALLKYLDTDLVCYRTATPQTLAVRQADIWDPWLDWFEEHYGARLTVTRSLIAVPCPAHTKAAVSVSVEQLDDWLFTILQLSTVLAGSIVLGLAFTAQAIAPQDLFDAVWLEERYKSEIYEEDRHGPDPHTSLQQSEMRREIDAAALFLAHLEQAAPMLRKA